MLFMRCYKMKLQQCDAVNGVQTPGALDIWRDAHAPEGKKIMENPTTLSAVERVGTRRSTIHLTPYTAAQPALHTVIQ